MTTSYFNRGTTMFNSPLDHQSRHIPVKRIAPCPPSEHIHAQAKRSRMVQPPSSFRTLPKNKPQDENAARAIAWGQANCFQSYYNVGTSVSSFADNNVKGLRYDPVNSLNIQRASTQQRSTPANTDARKSRCCPILTSSSAGYSTPPYCLNTSQGKDAKRSIRRRNISQRLKRRSIEGKKIKNNAGCLSLLKNAAQGTVKTAQACLEKNVPQPEMNALSVYHSFLKQREDAMKVEKSSTEVLTTVTVVTQGTVSRTSDSVRYSSNFAPQLTSTPTKGRTTNAFERLEGISEFKKPLPPGPASSTSAKNKADCEENTLSDILKALEEERLAGKSHISFPLDELTDMVKDLQKQQKEEVTDSSACTASTGTTATNNNNDDLSLRIKPKISRSSLPGMYPIGAPRAASSPIADSRKRGNFAIFDESVPEKYGGNLKYRHVVREESAYLTGYYGEDGNVWRPW
ncbi:uncharacterized protein LOC120328238 [Styela clava]